MQLISIYPANNLGPIPSGISQAIPKPAGWGSLGIRSRIETNNNGRRLGIPTVLSDIPNRSPSGGRDIPSRPRAAYDALTLRNVRPRPGYPSISPSGRLGYPGPSPIRIWVVNLIKSSIPIGISQLSPSWRSGNPEHCIPSAC